MSIFDHLDANSNHNSGICSNRDCTPSASQKHINLPSSLAKCLKNETKKFLDEELMNHMKLLSSINQLEALNQSLAAIQPKFIMRKNPNTYDMFAVITAMRFNHGSIILKYILMECGFPINMIPNSLIEHWTKLDNAKSHRRIIITDPKFKRRRKEYKSLRRLSNNSVKNNLPPKSQRENAGSYKYL